MNFLLDLVLAVVAFVFVLSIGGIIYGLALLVFMKDPGALQILMISLVPFMFGIAALIVSSRFRKMFSEEGWLGWLWIFPW
jgi:hypothetical protein